MPTYPPRRPTPPGAAGSWRDARRAPADEVDQAAEREQPAWSPAVIRVGGTWLVGVVTAWRPLSAGRWAAHVLWGPPLTQEWVIHSRSTLRPARLTAALPPEERES
ncbi:hypothetical protein ACWCXH_33690 [Kitasatospora sp. NPDC001660]